MNEYAENEILLLSGIQHFRFCRRQWALIHLENQWQENVKTIEGNFVHTRCHDEDKNEQRGDLLIVRGLRVNSYYLGLTGQCDVVEFHKRQDDSGAKLNKRDGTWDICPIEYKKGKPKSGDEDVSQLCAEAMCLEEMFGIAVEEGYIYYAEIKRRLKVELTPDLKDKVKKTIKEMHEAFRRKHTPLVKPSMRCRSCSLKDICLPILQSKTSVNNYYEKYLGDEQ